MKQKANRPEGNLKRALITASAASLIGLAQTSCGGIGGMLGRDKGGDDPALVAEEEPERKKGRGSLFKRSKKSNAWIDEDVQTTRRDRYAAQNKTDFGTGQDTASATPATPATPASPATPAGPTTPERAVAAEPDPQPKPTPPSRVAATPARPDEGLRLPTLESDFPQPKRPAATDPDPEPPLIVEEEGYVPLQPKLPKLETIEPPSE